jgi:hypothetical protein
LIYFISRDDTYVVSSVFTCLMIIGGFAAGVRILLENNRQDTIFWKIRKIPEKCQKIIFYQKTPEARRRRREEPGAASRTGGVAWPLAAPTLCEGALAHSRSRPFAYFIVPENLSQGGLRERHTASTGRKTPEREKLSGRQKSAREIPSRRGEIVTIVITIGLDFIGIIISITSTFISTITMPSRYNIVSWILLYSLGKLSRC